jgi:hypothetical protein
MPRSENVTMHLTEESIDIIMDHTAYSRDELEAKLREAEARGNICVFVFPKGAFDADERPFMGRQNPSAKA